VRSMANHCRALPGPDHHRHQARRGAPALTAPAVMRSTRRAAARVSIRISGVPVLMPPPREPGPRGHRGAGGRRTERTTRSSRRAAPRRPPAISSGSRDAKTPPSGSGLRRPTPAGRLICRHRPWRHTACRRRGVGWRRCRWTGRALVRPPAQGRHDQRAELGHVACPHRQDHVTGFRLSAISAGRTRRSGQKMPGRQGRHRRTMPRPVTPGSDLPCRVDVEHELSSRARAPPRTGGGEILGPAERCGWETPRSPGRPGDVHARRRGRPASSVV